MTARPVNVGNTVYRPVPFPRSGQGTQRPMPSPETVPQRDSRAMARIEANTLAAPQPKPHVSVTYADSGNPNQQRFAASLMPLASMYLNDNDVYHSGRLQPYQQNTLDTAVLAALRSFPFDIRWNSGANIVDTNDSLRVDVGLRKDGEHYTESISARIVTGWAEAKGKYFLNVKFQDGIGKRTKPSRWTGALVNNIESTIYLTEKELVSLLPDPSPKTQKLGSAVERILRGFGFKA